jgi:hypothetical protein
VNDSDYGYRYFNYGSNLQLEHYRLSNQNNNTTCTPTDDLLNASYPTNQVKIGFGDSSRHPSNGDIGNVS